MKRIARRVVISLFLCLLVLPFVFPQKHELPKSLGRLALVKTLEGRDAQAFVDQLHQKAVAPKSSVTGEYRHGNSSATLYVSLYSSARDAKEAGSRMMRLIKGGNRAFGHYSEEFRGRLLIGRCVGMGQIHFFFQERERVSWLSIDPSLEKEGLESLLKTIPPANAK